MRPSADEVFMEMADVQSRRATCPRRHVGAVLVDSSGVVVSTGYNGSPSGEPHCDDVGCLMVDGHCKRSTHAERNAIDHASKDVAGGTLYTTASPCGVCAAAIVFSKVKRVVYRDEYPAPDAVASLRRHGVVVERVKR